MYEYDEECLRVFLEQQTKLLKEPVAHTLEEADEFLSDCMAVVCSSLKEVKKYFDDEGADISGMTLAELEDIEEVFKLSNGRYLIVEA